MTSEKSERSGESRALFIAVKIYGAFYAFEQGFGVSRFFKIYVSDEGLHAVWLADRDCEFAVARMQAMGHAGGLAMSNIAAVATRARALEADYDKKVAFDPTWQKEHKANFSARTGEIRRVALLPNPKPSVRPNCYSLLDLEWNGGKRRFYLVGAGDAATVSALLERVAVVEGSVRANAAPSSASFAPPAAPTVPGKRARKADTLCWIGAGALSIVGCAWMYHQAPSPFALVLLLLVFKFHAMLYNIYLTFNVNRDTAERVEANRRSTR